MPLFFPQSLAAACQITQQVHFLSGDRVAVVGTGKLGVLIVQVRECYLFMYVYVCMCVCVCMYVCTYVCTYECVRSVHACMHACLSVCVSECIHIYLSLGFS